MLRAISDRKPEILYPYFDVFVRLLDNENSFLKWGAILIVANLTRVDSESRFEAIYEKYFSAVRGPVMITAGKIIRNAHKIGFAKPNLRERIIRDILKVADGKYETAECKRVVMSHAIDALEKMIVQSGNQEAILEFVRKQLRSKRIPVRRKAVRFMHKYGELHDN